MQKWCGFGWYKDCGSKITFKNSLQNIQESGFTFGLERDFTAKSDLYIKLDTEASAEKLHQNLKLLRDNYVNENIQLTFLKCNITLSAFGTNTEDRQFP